LSAPLDGAILRGVVTQLTVALRHMPYGTEFYIRDPDGYILGFIEPAPPESGQ
jgi:hypothetical protein